MKFNDEKDYEFIISDNILFAINLDVNAKEFDTALADENVEIEVISENSVSFTFFDNPSDVLSGLVRSTAKPTKYWNLSAQDYTGNLIEVRASWLYTNYYFSPKNGTLILDYNISPINANGTKMQIAVYNKSTDKFVKYYTTGGVPTAACLYIT